MAQDIGDWMEGDGATSVWLVVEDDQGRLLGFQQIGQSPHGPPETCEIATFLGQDPLPPGAAATLFETTANTARRLQFRWISARISVANDAARVYYQSNGFRPLEQTPTHLKMYFDLD